MEDLAVQKEVAVEKLSFKEKMAWVMSVIISCLILARFIF